MSKVKDKNKQDTKAKVHNSDLLSEMLNAITPGEQKNIDRKMMLAARIYDAMKAKGWNQKMLAEKMGKQPSEVSKWLSGTHTFTSDTLWAIGDMLGIDLLPVENLIKDKKIEEVRYVPIYIRNETIPNSSVKTEWGKEMSKIIGHYTIKRQSSFTSHGES